jgi:Protein of unknown function (DUF2612)
MASKGIDYYKSLITSEHKNRPKYIAWLAVLLTPLNDAAIFLNTMYQYFDINIAVGDQLDLIGVIVGQNRLVDITTTIDDVSNVDSIQNFDTLDSNDSNLIDDDYRFLLKAKMINNVWDGTIETLVTMWNKLFPENTIIIYDNQDMTLTVTLAGNLDNIKRQLITNGYIIPKPMCVRINYYFGTLPIFGYDYDKDFVSGYDNGHWL